MTFPLQYDILWYHHILCHVMLLVYYNFRHFSFKTLLGSIIINGDTYLSRHYMALSLIDRVEKLSELICCDNIFYWSSYNASDFCMVNYKILRRYNFTYSTFLLLLSNLLFFLYHGIINAYCLAFKIMPFRTILDPRHKGYGTCGLIIIIIGIIIFLCIGWKRMTFKNRVRWILFCEWC